MGLSENSVPLNPMVFMIIIPTKWLFHWGYTLFSDILKLGFKLTTWCTGFAGGESVQPRKNHVPGENPNPNAEDS